MRIGLLAFAIAITQVIANDARAEWGDELLRLTAPDDAPFFGNSMDISGSKVVVGQGIFFSYETEPRSNESAYLFDLAQGAQPIQTLRSESPNDGDWFGASVAVEGNFVIVGAPYEDSIDEDSGAAYLFDVTTGEQLFRFLPADALTDHNYGFALAIGGNYAAVSMRSLPIEERGPRFIDVYDTNTGSLVHRFMEENRGFGASVAIDGDVMIVGGTSPVVPRGGGSVYAYDLNSGDKLWEYTSVDRSDDFGVDVDVSGDRVVVGASAAQRQMGPVSARFSGAAYILDASTGDLLHELEPRQAYLHQEFGEDVAIEGNIALVGSRNDDRDTLGGQVPYPCLM